MQSSQPQASLSCIPCAKRKVRCDRTMPCSHCRRRRGDICEYPIPITSSSSLPRRSNANPQANRIEKLEQYIRSLGHDPAQIAAQPISLASIERENGEPKRRRLDHSEYESISRQSSAAKLVEHDEQTTYVESLVSPLKIQY
jgi:hypothetical protein